MRVLIVARTRMGKSHHRCIGGLANDCRSLRLLTVKGDYHPLDKCPFQIGDIWEMEFDPAINLVGPHVEDVLVRSARRIGKQAYLLDHLLGRIWPWWGGIELLFGGRLRFTSNGNGYVCERIGVPDNSTGFWVPDKALTIRDDGKHFDYPVRFGAHGLAYVGEATPPNSIKAGTLVRVSLAKWWKPDDAEEFEERCYLQISGWYE